MTAWSRREKINVDEELTETRLLGPKRRVVTKESVKLDNKGLYDV